MAYGYACPECGSRMRHGEVSPGTARWTCPKCGWTGSETVAARYLQELPDDDVRENEMTKEEVVEATAYPPGRFAVEGERSLQQAEGLTSEGERPAHVTNRPLGGDPEMAKKMESYADDHGITINDGNVDAIQAQVGYSSASAHGQARARVATPDPATRESEPGQAEPRKDEPRREEPRKDEPREPRRDEPKRG